MLPTDWSYFEQVALKKGGGGGLIYYGRMVRVEVGDG